MDPTIALLEHCVEETKRDDPGEAYTREQLLKMLEFTKMVTTWYSQIDRLPTPALEGLFRGGAKLARLFGRGETSNDGDHARTKREEAGAAQKS
jgi:hypothetical protein